MEDLTEDSLFTLIQKYLKPSPLIIWGSGATIPFEMPSMNDLKNELEITEEGNLEEILSRIEDNDQLRSYEQKIFQSISDKDNNFRKQLKESTSSKSLQNLIRFFYTPHPSNLNIITTNYDCVLEYVFSLMDLPYSDGFSGREFSKFKEENFKNKKFINLYKVHGSLRWESMNNHYSYFNENMNAIYPNNNKYQQAAQEPFRTLIAQADNRIKNSTCFLAIGFGFNDEHLTPKIKTAIEEDKPIVIIAKTITPSAKEQLKNANRYILIEENEQTETKFTVKENNKDSQEIKLDGSYWKIEEFNNILT
jgi:hypothetical protein